MQPQRRAFADGGGLGGLVMGVSESGQALVLLREIRRLFNGCEQQGAYLQECLFHLYYVGVVADVTAGRAEMDDGFRLGARLAESEDVRHNVVPHFLFAFGGICVIDVGDVRFHFRNLLLRNRDAKLLSASASAIQSFSTW